MQEIRILMPDEEEDYSTGQNQHLKQQFSTIRIMPSPTRRRSRSSRTSFAIVAGSFLTGAWFGLMPYIFKLADQARGYHATGGEVLLLLVPLIVYLIGSSIKQYSSILKRK